MNSLCHDYVREVLKFRKALNLTSIAQADEFESRFILPSLALVQWLPGKGRLLDIGSGMGVPGIPLLIAMPGLQGVLVERRKKRAEFLRHVVRKLSLRAEVYDADINELSCLHVDVCVARAVADESLLLQMCARHVNPGALAVLPVPRNSNRAQVAGWRVEGEHLVAMSADAVVDGSGDGQLIRCYRFDRAESEGFT